MPATRYSSGVGIIDPRGALHIYLLFKPITAIRRIVQNRRDVLKKLMLIVAMLAMMALVAAPVIAQIEFDGDRHDRNNGFFFGGQDRFDNNGGGVSFDLGDTENESGDISTENSFSIEGNNNNACLGQLQFGQTGNFTNQQGALQYASDADDLGFAGPEIEFAPENETACEQEVQQAAAASSWGM